MLRVTLSEKHLYVNYLIYMLPCIYTVIRSLERLRMLKISLLIYQKREKIVLQDDSQKRKKHSDVCPDSCRNQCFEMINLLSLLGLYVFLDSQVAQSTHLHFLQNFLLCVALQIQSLYASTRAVARSLELL